MLDSRLSRFALILLAVGALSGCGRTAAVEVTPAIDSVLMKLPANDARKSVVNQQQQRRDAEPRGAETTKVGAPGNDRAG